MPGDLTADMDSDARIDAVINGMLAEELLTAGDGKSSIMKEISAVARLARMDTSTYQSERKAEAKALSWSLAALDREVNAHRRSTLIQTTVMSSQWLGQCSRTPQGEIRSNLENALIALRSDPRIEDIARYDEMLRLVILMRPVPRAQINADKEFLPQPIQDHHYTQIQEHLQREGLKALARDTVRQAVDARAREICFHPVKQYLDPLAWDGTPRLKTWLCTYLGAEATPYTTGIGEMFLTAMIARVRSPGCKSDYMLVLEGPQGARKSTACAILGGEWFSDCLPDIRAGKDVSQHLNGKWLIEVAELSALDKAEAAALKAFVTRNVEQYRPSYGHCEVFEPRQCVFIGTTNKTAYLRDETGGRRFWPVAVGHIDTDALARDRDQLFAEADARFKSGADWWPSATFEAEHIAAEQSARYQADAWEDAIGEWLDSIHDDPSALLGQAAREARCTVLMVARNALGMDVQKVGRTDQNRIIAAMERLGWVSGQRTNTSRNYVPGAGAIARKKERDRTNEPWQQ
jgi:predicted P-loop ATPase